MKVNKIMPHFSCCDDLNESNQFPISSKRNIIVLCARAYDRHLSKTSDE